MKTNPLNSILLIVILLLMASGISYAQPNAPSGKKWEKINNLSDEFNGGFDTGKWRKELWDYANTPTKMIAQNSGVSGGNLWIKATLGPDPLWFQSSRIYSNAQIKFPMYTESRIKTAHLSAYNTFWLNNGGIDSRDEIDIIENNSRPSCGCQPNFPWQMNSQYFQVTNGNTVRSHGNFDNRNLSNGNPKKGVRWNEQYHVVGMWWKDAKNIQFYLDGEPAGKVVAARDLTRNLNLIWDLWTDDENFLGGVAVKSHLRDNNINTMKVDWVHTYKLVNSSGGTPPPPTGGGGNSATQFRYDVGTNSSVVWPEYTRLSNTTRAQSGSFGWANTNNIGSRDRGAARGRNNINRDINFSKETRFFTQNLSNGNWNVLITFGDTYARRNMNVAAEGQNKLTNINTNRGQYLSRSFNVNVNDGKLDLRFSVGNGGDVWSITRIWIRKVGTNGAKFTDEEITLADTQPGNAFAAFPNPVKANGTITIAGSVIGNPITIYNSNGQIVKEVMIVSENQEIPLYEFAKGLYLISSKDTGIIKLAVQ